MNPKLKIAWICPLEFTPFRDRLSFHADPVETISPWLTLLTQIFERHTDEVELYVISAPPRLAEDATITEKGIHYHFISNQLPMLGGKIPFIIKKLTHYYTLRRKAKKVIREITPDLIEFHGAEHDLSWSFFDLDYPKILTPQFFVNNYYRFRQTKYLHYWMKVEKNVYAKCKHFSYRNEHMKNEILALNPAAQLHKYQYPIKRPQIHSRDYPLKDADIVFTARLIKSKGIEDLIQAIREIKKEIPGINAKIIGQCDPDYMVSLKGLVRSSGIEENIVFLGFLPTQEAMFEEVAKSKISVLPTHFDLIPGTVLEAMFMGIPVVAYAAGGLPELNLETETIRLVEVGNVNLLAKEIIALLKDENMRVHLASTAEENVTRKFDNNMIYNDMIRAYKAILKDFNHN